MNDDVTTLLARWRAGDPEAEEALFDRIYDELRRLAGGIMRGERAGHTLQPTALANEAWLKLADQTRCDWQSRSHFLSVAAQAMRRILVDHARRLKAEKRLDPALRVDLDEGIEAAQAASPALLDLDAALGELATLDERQARIVELRSFGGLGMQEIGDLLGVSRITVWREFRMAVAWLAERLEP